MFGKKVSCAVGVVGVVSAIFMAGCGSGPIAPAAAPHGASSATSENTSTPASPKRGPLPPTTSSPNDLSDSTVSSMAATMQHAFAEICEGAKGADASNLALYNK